MNCEACGHTWHDHNVSRYDPTYLLGAEWVDGCCRVCRHERGPCYPWEFR